MARIELDSPEVVYLSERDWRLAHLFAAIGPIESGRTGTAFSSLAHCIIGQMLSVKAGASITQRLQELCGGNLSPRAVAALGENEIKGCGMSGRKASNLRALAAYALENNIEHLDGQCDDAIRAQLMALPGVGAWTCDMFLLFHLERPDILPLGDGAFRQVFAWLYGAPVTSEGVQAAVCDLWHPYASTPVRYFYRVLDGGMLRAGSARDQLGF